MNYYTNLDLNLNMLKQVRLDPLWSDPPLNELIEGRIWYNRTEDSFKYFDGKEVKIIEWKRYLNNSDIDAIWDEIDSYQDNLLKGKELAYYTRKIKQEFDNVIDNIQQSDWNQTDESAKSYIRNKPPITGQGSNVVIEGKAMVGDGPTNPMDLTTKEYVDSKTSINLVVEADPSDVKTGTLKVVAG